MLSADLFARPRAVGQRLDLFKRDADNCFRFESHVLQLTRGLLEERAESFEHCPTSHPVSDYGFWIEEDNRDVRMGLENVTQGLRKHVCELQVSVISNAEVLWRGIRGAVTSERRQYADRAVVLLVVSFFDEFLH